MSFGGAGGGSQVGKAQFNVEPILDQAAFGRIRSSIERELNQTARSVERATARAGKSAEQAFGGGVFKRASVAFTGTIDSIEKRLEGFGLSIRDVSVILGAGLAGGVAFAIRSLIGLGAALLEAAEKLEIVRNFAEQTFGEEGFKQIQDFAIGAEQALGLSERAALEASASFGAFAKNLGVPKSQLDELSIALTQTGVALARLRGTGTEDALQALQAGLRGEFDPLEKFGISLKQAQVEAEATRLGIGNLTGELGPLARVLATVSLAQVQAKDALDQLGTSSDSLVARQARLAAQTENLKASFGSVLIGVKESAVGLGTTLVNAYNAAVDVSQKLIDAIGGVTSRLEDAGDSVAEVAADFIRTALGMETVDKAAEGLAKRTDDAAVFQREFNKAMDEGASVLGAQRAAQEAVEGQSTATGEEIAKLVSVEELLASAEVKAALASEHQAQLLASLGNVAVTVRGEFLALAAAFDQRVESFTPKFGDSFRDQGKKAGGGANKAADAAKRVARAQEDAADKIQDAQEAIAEAFEDAAERRGDAERRLAEVEEKAAQRIQDARRKLTETEVEAARRIGDARRRLRDARISDSFTEVELLHRIQRAQLEGNAEAENQARLELSRLRHLGQVRDAEIALQRTQVDNERDLADARRDLTRDQIEADRDVADARRDLARTIDDTGERIAESQERLVETQKQVARAIEDALESASRAAGGAAGKAELTVARLAQSFRDNAEDTKSFVKSINRIEDRLDDFAFNVEGIADKDIKQAFLARLVEMGPEAVKVIKELAGSSEDALQGVVDAFGNQIAAAKEAADFQFDKFPPNFAEKLEAARKVTAQKLTELTDEFDRLPKKTGEAARDVSDRMFVLAHEIQAAVRTGLLPPLSDLEEQFLQDALAADNAKDRSNAFKGLIASLQGRSVEVPFHTPGIDETRDKISALERELGGLQAAAASAGDAVSGAIQGRPRRSGGPVLPIQGFGFQHGGPMGRGGPYLVGEAGPELIIPSAPGFVVSNRELMDTLRALLTKSGTGDGWSGDIIVNEVASDPVATANAVAARLGRRARRP